MIGEGDAMEKIDSPTTIVLESSDIVAFIMCVSDIYPQPFLRAPDQKVCFRFNEDIAEFIELFYKNIPVPISDYCKNLRLVRSMIFNFKAGQRRVY